MKKILTFVVLVVSLFLLVSCGENQQQGAASGAFRGGTEGVTGEFEDFGVVEDSVSSVFDTESFPIEVTIKNKGEYKVKPGDVTIKLMGPAKEEFAGVTSWELKNKGDVEIISDLLPQGGEETLTFATDAKYAKPVNGILEKNWYASIEAKYQTYLIIPEACLKEDLTDKRICEVKEPKTFFVSGAPITISSMDEDTAGQGIMALRMKVSNIGGGKVTKLGDTFGTYDKVAFSIDDAAWECKSGGKVNEAKMVDNEAEILCKTKEPLSKGTLATKQLRMTFDYLYRTEVQEKVNIKQSVK